MPAPLLLAPIVGVIMAALSRLVASRVGQWVLSALLFLGIGFATHNVAVAPLLGQVQSYANNTGEAMVWLAMLNFDKAITMVISAYTARAALGAARTFLARRA